VPGLRGEEVTQRANISPTWYTSLEQGRGGAPSTDVRDRIAAAPLLNVSTSPCWASAADLDKIRSLIAE
jgi:transcriptional regulator with XRE-family HTH domain